MPQKPGAFWPNRPVEHHPPPPLVRAERVELPVGDEEQEPTYFWSSSGDSFYDAALTQPVGLAILRPLREWTAYEGIPTDVTGTQFQRVATERGQRVLFQDEGGNLYADERLEARYGGEMATDRARQSATDARGSGGEVTDLQAIRSRAQ